MAGNGPSISVHVKIVVDPSKADEFLQALRPTFEKVIAEPLNTFFELYRDGQHPGVFKLVENWNATPEYMINVQRKKDYYKPYHETIEPLLLKPFEVEIYNRMPNAGWVNFRQEVYIGQDRQLLGR